MAALPFVGNPRGATRARRLGRFIEPYFPSAAHQLVWRNWDLVPKERIARALGCDPIIVAKLAHSMSLETQQVPGQYRSRLQFKILRRNWDFVPYNQLTLLLNMPEGQIREFLLQDAFYIAHLGPKPDGPEIRAENASNSGLGVI